MKNKTKPTVGKEYDVSHSRKGQWRATLVAISGEGTDDEWYVLSDDPTSPVRAQFCTLKAVA